MQTIKILFLLLAFVPTYVQAQNKAKTSNQTRTIEIDNDNGELIISFKNGIITKFIVNDEPIAKDRYDNYQDIIDEFSNDGTQPVTPPTPEPPAPPAEDDHADRLYTIITDYLTDKALINTANKFKIELKRKHLKVNGQKLSNLMHQDCLDIFNDIYGHSLNGKSEVKFRKSRNSYKSSIKIDGKGRQFKIGLS